MPAPCPRCRRPVSLAPTGGYVAFCAHCLAFLLPSEFTPDDLRALLADSYRSSIVLEEKE